MVKAIILKKLKYLIQYFSAITTEGFIKYIDVFLAILIISGIVFKTPNDVPVVKAKEIFSLLVSASCGLMSVFLAILILIITTRNKSSEWAFKREAGYSNLYRLGFSLVLSIGFSAIGFFKAEFAARPEISKITLLAPMFFFIMAILSTSLLLLFIIRHYMKYSVDFQTEKNTLH